MTHSLEIDVVIPTYNQTDLLLKAVNSCKQQSYGVNKIWIVDDGSTKEVVSWLIEHFTKDPQVELVLSEHTGLPGIARETGILKSTAEWVAFLDADDYWHPKKIEKQVALIASHGLSFVYTNAAIVIDGEVRDTLLAEMPTSIKFEDLARTNWVVNSSVLVRRNLLTEATGYASGSRVRAVEDFATWLRVASLVEMRGIDLPLTFYRMAEDSIRKDDTQDPRIHAFADFLLWLQTPKGELVKSARKKRKEVLRMIENQYGH